MKEKGNPGAAAAQDVTAQDARDMDKTVFDPGFAGRDRESETLDLSKTPEGRDREAQTLDLGKSAPPADADTYAVEPTVLDLGSWAPASDSEPGLSRDGTRAPSRAQIEAAANEPHRAIKAKPAAVHTALPIGFRLFEYRIDGVLGQGGFGIAYAATDVNLNAKVVIKEYLPEDFAYRTTDDSVCARNDEDQDFYQTGLDSFLVEARTLATFRHPNIVRVARFFEANRTAYMVLEYERGQSLKAWRKKHENVPESELVSLLAPLFNGLAVVHKAGYLHRDIKPDNIYVRADGSPVLLDFGSARRVQTNRELTNIVSPGFAPFEQYHSQGKQGPWTDIYSMGAVLYWMVTGKKPVEAASRVKTDTLLPATSLADVGYYGQALLGAI
ncbi:MAG TPA: serine/threonine-protein kinase, partial [Usitatibacter sp.]|nr:serine/threonine-protein kinase [Usitatibacter sp.]